MNRRKRKNKQNFKEHKNKGTRKRRKYRINKNGFTVGRE